MSLLPTRPSEQDEKAEHGGLAGRLRALDRVLNFAGDRIDAGKLRPARHIARRASERLALSANHTVVALAGATGSGKSSLFNALAGLELSAGGLRRPTTGAPHACVWGPEGAGELLDWLGIPRRHQTARESALDADTQAELRGLALLDLPDHDSTELSHRLEVDRLVELVDMLVWVLDPQKYADAAVHARYLRPLARHAGVIVVVLNQIDRLTQDEADQCIGDLRKLLDADGLQNARLLVTSATRGDGLVELRTLLTEVVAAREAASLRLAADLDGISAGLVGLTGAEAREDIDRAAVKRLCTALASAAGVPAVGEAVERTYRHRATLSTGWPLTRWIARVVRPDPLRRLHLDLGRPSDQPELGPPPLTSLEKPHAVLKAQVETAVRELADTATADLPAPWPAEARRAALAGKNDLPDALDRAIGTTDLGMSRTPLWWRFVGGLQWLLLAALVGGAIWLVGLSAIATLGFTAPQAPEVGVLGVPALLVVAGLFLAPLLALAAGSIATRRARKARARAESALNDAVTVVARERVLAPVRQELRVYAQLRDALAELAGH
jgi:GTP-binding protein EngB required for normal cell division